MPSIRQQDTDRKESVWRMPCSMSYRYSLHRRKRSSRPNLVFRPRHKVFAQGDFSHGLDSRNRRLPARWLGYWSYKVSKKQGQNPRNVCELADDGGKVCVSGSDTADLDSLGQRLPRFLEGCAL